MINALKTTEFPLIKSTKNQNVRYGTVNTTNVVPLTIQTVPSKKNQEK